MDFLIPREPVNAWSHALGVLLALPAAWLLWRQSRGDSGKRTTLFIYSASLAFCYSASTLVHGLKLPAAQLDVFDRIDRFGIYFLISGTYTAMAWTLLAGRWRAATLISVWGATALAGLALALKGVFPSALNVGLYLVMGWGSVACLFQVARVVPARALWSLVAGGVLYTIGAIVNFIRAPSLWPGVFGPHELFHVFVLLGSAAHFWFVLDVVTPHDRHLPRGPNRVRAATSSSADPLATASARSGRP